VVTTANNVKIVGHLNVPGRIAASASLLYARNLFAFLETLVDKTAKTLAINRDDDLVKATMLTDGGKVVHPAFVKADQQPAKGQYVEPAAIPAKTMVADASPKKAAPKKAAAPKSPSSKPKGIA
ncbi:NAD(P)(+) transhydrogenase (Re/Si-specific) subunit alpha, partial [Mesorhizobium sp. M7A.F.Ca.CA.001.12.2.1]